jgi:zinc protease
VTVFAGKVHRDKLAEYTALLREALLSPGFREADLERNRELLLSYLTTTLRSGSDELLGLEALQGRIYRDHPYATPASGTEQGLRAITMDDVRAFYRDHYTQARLMVGVAGGYPEGFVEELESAMKALPKGDVARTPVPEPKQPEGRTYTLIDKSTGSAGIHLGYPIDVTRKDPDYYPLMVANSWLGEHRTFHGKLMQELRGKRGLNYGDYSYIEHWANPPATSHPTPNRPRREQAFSVWIRPVAPENARFALRAALHFLDEAREEGMTQPELDATREFLTGYSKLWAQTSSQRLGFLMDSRYYGMPSYLEEIEKRLKDLTVEQVNAAIRKYIRTDQYEAVIVTDKAEQLARELKEETPSPIRYNAEPPPGVKDEDEKIIERPVKPTEVRVVPVGEMFEGAGATGAK